MIRLIKIKDVRRLKKIGFEISCMVNDCAIIRSNYLSSFSGICLGLMISASGAALSNYMEGIRANIEDVLGIYQNAAKCMQLNTGPQEVQYHCEESWERYNAL
ncbi:MAG: hypothetical protein HY517_00550 [Candidatus Aenigmarchaeota archaeon]|nr:hypothetical protein [Candidatus Aenigmarchaeota archaeon]